MLKNNTRYEKNHEYMIPAPSHSVIKEYSEFEKKKAMKNFNYCCTRLKQLLIFLFYPCKHLNKRQMNKVSGRKFFFIKLMWFKMLIVPEQKQNKRNASPS